jgi:hypothetical protein
MQIVKTCMSLRAWRQKIEAWLMDSEKEEKMSEEQRRRRRPPAINRRSTNETSTESTEGDNRNGSSILDTLPEEKAQSGQYRRVYSDWKPTVEKTDVVGAMEAIEGKQNTVELKMTSIKLAICNYSSGISTSKHHIKRQVCLEEIKLECHKQ